MSNRRDFLQKSLAATGVLAALDGFSFSRRPKVENAREGLSAKPSQGIRFSVIGLNHGHIYGQTDAMIRGGGELVAFYAKEPDLCDAFAKRYPNAKKHPPKKPCWRIIPFS